MSDAMNKATGTSTVPHLEEGVRLAGGRYIVQEMLCAGGFSFVYRCLDAAGHEVAVKEFFVEELCQRLKNGSVRARRGKAATVTPLREAFRIEAQTLANLRHEAIVPIIDHFHERSAGYIVMPYLPGADLLDVVLNHPEWLSRKRLLVTIDRILAATEYLHENRLVHGDIAPDNFLLNADALPVMIDLGAVSLQGGERGKARMVKDGYSAPELFDPASIADTASDVYALGATIYQLISGKRPLRADRRMASFRSFGTDPFRTLDGDAYGMPAVFVNSVNAALALMPGDRPATAGVMRQALHMGVEAMTARSGRPTTQRLPAAGTDAPSQATRPAGYHD